MATNAQNTVAGTSNGGNLIAPVGNWFLEQLGALSNVVAVGADQIGSLSTSIQAAKLAIQQTVNPPMQTAPATNITSAADYMSDPDRVQKALMIAAVGSILLVGGFYLIKKL